MSWAWIMTAWLAGFALLLTELFVPGIVLGTIGTFLVGGAVVATFVYQSGAAGSGLLVGSLALFAFVIRAGISGLSHRHQLNESAGFVGTDDLSELLGQTGVAATMLRPGGFATIGGQRIDVVTRGEAMEKGAPLVVVGVQGNVVEVQETEAAPPP